MKNNELAKKFSQDLIEMQNTLNEIDNFSIYLQKELNELIKEKYGQQYGIDDFDCDDEYTTHLIFGGILQFNLFIGRVLAYKWHFAEYKYGKIEDVCIYSFKNDFLLIKIYFEDIILKENLQNDIEKIIQDFLKKEQK